MGYKDLEIGNILIEMREGEPCHSLIWVGGADPLIHATEAPMGVYRHTAQYLGRKTAGGVILRVYSCRQPHIAMAAAEFAEGWAAGKSKFTDQDSINLSNTPKYEVLKTPYSLKRLEVARASGTGEWKVDSLFRVVKAVANFNDGIGLSPHNGVSCSQFITYCYQAAALREYIGDVIKPGDSGLKPKTHQRGPLGALGTWAGKHFRGTDDFWRQKEFLAQRNVFAGLKKQGDLVEKVLGAHTQKAADIIPSGLKVDAKTQSVKNLTDSLHASGSAFQFVGKLVIKCRKCSKTYDHKVARAALVGGDKRCAGCNEPMMKGEQYLGDLTVLELNGPQQGTE